MKDDLSIKCSRLEKSCIDKPAETCTSPLALRRHPTSQVLHEAKSKHSVMFNGSLARIANRGCKYKSRLVYGKALITGRSCIRSRSVYSRVLHNVTRLHTMWCHFATKSTFSLPVLARRSTTPHKSSAQGICACPFQNAGDFKVHIGCSGTLTAYTYAARAVDTNLMDPIRDLRRRPSSV